MTTGLASKLFAHEKVHADYVERFFKGLDHPRLSWLYYIGKGQYASAGSVLLRMTAVDGDELPNESSVEQRIGCVTVSLLELSA